MERYVCIHGHFYQPPRENPWTGLVERQAAAHPYHDWNERITEECYAANAASPILDGEGRERARLNNYARISFNFGPTLLNWMERHAPQTLHLIVEADRQSRERYGGHGSALAQVYNHQIMPLANRRDQYTQARWGLRDFVHRFGRPPEGMWLPETAVDLPTLEVLADLGIRFTILSPFQAQWVREIGAPRWRPTGVGGIDPNMPYRVTLPSGRAIAVFFYNGMISSAVAFEGLLHDGERFARRLLGGFDDDRATPQLVHIATDGESYGHHHRHGDMALAYALDYLDHGGQARLTNYGEYLERFPPTHEVLVLENTAWSCAHGLGRWRDNCGCHAGGHPAWSQGWRADLRETLDLLRDELAWRYETAAAPLLDDPWAARDAYVDLLLDRSPTSLERYREQFAPRARSRRGWDSALQLLELQRDAMLMYTSCGWFWDDPSGWETIQVLRYAARAVELARETTGDDLQPAFRERLGRVKSNVPAERDGARIFDLHICRPDRPRLRVTR
jgi:alpha-amylase/alpha-mannosidase (GH57 family)